MAVKSIRGQIIDEFIEDLSKTGCIAGNRLDALKELLNAEKIKKDKLANALKEEVEHEDS